MAAILACLGLLLLPLPLTAAVSALDLESRQDSDTNYCRRWSHQAQIVNGSLYIYGGRVITAASQTTDEWSKSISNEV